MSVSEEEEKKGGFSIDYKKEIFSKLILEKATQIAQILLLNSD